MTEPKEILVFDNNSYEDIDYSFDTKISMNPYEISFEARKWQFEKDLKNHNAAYQALEEELEQVKAELAYFKNGTRIKEIHYDEHLGIELATEKARAQSLENENKTLKTMTIKLWKSLTYFSASELDLKPDVFHDLIEDAHKLNAPFRKKFLTEHKDGK